MNAMDLSCAVSMKFTLSTPNPALLCSSMPDLALVPRCFNICAKQGLGCCGPGLNPPEDAEGEQIRMHSRSLSASDSGQELEEEGFRRYKTTNISIGCTSGKPWKFEFVYSKKHTNLGVHGR